MNNTSSLNPQTGDKFSIIKRVSQGDKVMKKYVIRVEFKGYKQIGYFKSEECITGEKSKALVCSKSYADGLCRGINFGINFYGDVGVKQAYVEEIK